MNRGRHYTLTNLVDLSHLGSLSPWHSPCPRREPAGTRSSLRERRFQLRASQGWTSFVFTFQPSTSTTSADRPRSFVL